MYFITTKRMLEVCFSAHPNIQYRTRKFPLSGRPNASYNVPFDMISTIGLSMKRRKWYEGERKIKSTA